MSQSSNVEALSGRGTVVAFLDLLFSCIGVFIAVITLQLVASQETPPAVGTDAHFAVLTDGSVLHATAEGVRTLSDVDDALRGSLVAIEHGYPRVEVLFSASAIDRQRDFENQLNRLVASQKPARAIEIGWRPAASEDALRKELERIADTLRTKETR